MNLVFKSHTLACTCGSRIAGTPFARFMDRILNHGATKRANELLAARKAKDEALATYRAAVKRKDTRGMSVAWGPLKDANHAVMKAERRA